MQYGTGNLGHTTVVRVDALKAPVSDVFNVHIGTIQPFETGQLGVLVDPAVDLSWLGFEVLQLLADSVVAAESPAHVTGSHNHDVQVVPVVAIMLTHRPKLDFSG